MQESDYADPREKFPYKSPRLLSIASELQEYLARECGLKITDYHAEEMAGIAVYLYEKLTFRLDDEDF